MTDNTQALLERLRDAVTEVISEAHNERADLLDELAEVKRERDGMAEALRVIQTNAMNTGMGNHDFRYTTVTEQGGGVMEAWQRHNELAPELIKRLIKETANEADAMIVLESVMLGVMLYYRPKPREAGEFMDSMTAAVIERLKS